jgi:heterodisulfide reductase subunit C
MLRLVSLPGQVAQDTFLEDIALAADTPLERCMQCGKCSAGCPVGFAMDRLPNQVVHLVQLGLVESALDTEAIWLCASCETCTTRCPMEIDLAAVMDALRQKARQVKGRRAGGRVGVFHDAFLDSVKRYGRAHELGMVAMLKLKTRDFFSDLGLGMKMFMKGKFRLLPQRVKAIRQVRGTFEE